MTGRNEALLLTTKLPFKALSEMSPAGGVLEELPIRTLPKLPGLMVMSPPATTVILAAAVLVPELPMATPESAIVPPAMTKLPPTVSVRSSGVALPCAPMRTPPLPPPWSVMLPAEMVWV